MYKLLLIIITWTVLKCEAGSQPHIVFVVADDLGWNDVSWHNPNLHTPHLDSLVREGVLLNQSYVQPTCTPSRVSFMTGYYPFKVGRQNHVLHPLSPTGVPLRFTFLPEKLRQAGYTTHLIGKWHLGYCNFSYTPTWRGFDTFFGFYNGATDYFSHTRNPTRRSPNSKWNEPLEYSGFDLRNNTQLSRKYHGVYSTTLLANATEELISSLDPENPMFLFLSFQSVHSPLQVPKSFEDIYSHIKDGKRRKYCGMVSAMDDAVGRIVSTLKKRGFWENALFIFTTDNGAQVTAGGSNWPLRGNKGTLWEGGTRAVAFVHGNLLKKKGYENNKLIHAVDWFPTILKVAGSDSVPGIDGIDQWNVISEDGEQIRNEMVYNIYDWVPPRAAIRVNDYKLIQGFPGKQASWLAREDNNGEKSTTCILNEDDPREAVAFRLYNVKADPTEMHNLAAELPDVTSALLHRLQLLSEQQMVPADDPIEDSRGHPKHWNGSFSPGWCVAH